LKNADGEGANLYQRRVQVRPGKGMVELRKFKPFRSGDFE